MLENTSSAERLDQRLLKEAHTLLKTLLDNTPDIRSVAIVFDYHLDDAGSLPAGTWLPSRPLKPEEVLSMCQAVDKVGFAIRKKHDEAISARLNEISDQQNQKITQETTSDGA